MDLNMTNLWFHGKEHIASSSISQAQPSAINCRNEELAVSAVNLGCIRSSEIAQNSRKSFQHGDQSLATPDDSCRLVLGLGPTPNLYYADSHSFGGNKTYQYATLLTQHYGTTDPGLMLGLSRCSSRNLQSTTASGSKNYSFARKTGIIFPLIDEGSTSAKRKRGGYMLPLLFAPRSEDLCLNGTSPDTDVQQHDGTGCDTESDHDRSLNHHEIHPSPDLSITADCSFAATSDIVAGTSGEQRSHQRHPKKCRFNGCSKGARGASGLCISHGGG
ncbi:unnamed protein product [Miscanthus lutarioriparius]|uniref:WRKY19-like zinc finger domain-containing protein n=1 Tax=Miscanthus lutarioriparius TaxID=422564 RepID=A0A811QJJ1_9POAL|nr:unnamed protein product [Miscanthus lutarioriparius]